MCLSAYPPNFQRNSLSDIEGEGRSIERKVLYRCLCFVVLIVEAFSCAYKQQQEPCIRDLGHYADLVPIIDCIAALSHSVNRWAQHSHYKGLELQVKRHVNVM